MSLISLPNGTVINAKTICLVKAVLAYKSRASAEYDTKPSVVIVYRHTPQHEGHEQIMCDTDEEAIDLRDRIIARLNEYTPIIPV